MSNGTQISDMTDSAADFPEGSFVPFVVTDPATGLLATSNYRYDGGRYLAKYATLADDTGAALIGSDDGASGSLWATIAGFITYLRSSAGSAIVGFLQSGTGAVTRSVQAKLRDVVSAKDFGAAGDGVTNDTAAIQAAIDYLLGAGGGVLYFPPGTYMVSALTCTITTFRTITFLGDGKKSSAIGKLSGTTTPLLSIDATANPDAYGGIEGLAFLGLDNTHSGVVFTKAARFFLRDILIQDCDIGLDCVGAEIVEITNPTFNGNVIGMRVRKSGGLYGNLFQIYGGEARANSSWAFDIGQGSNFVWIGTDLEANGTADQTCTISDASPGVISATAHGLVADQPVVFSTSGALPTGLTAGTIYYVLSSGLTANAFEVSATAGGSAINTSSVGSGTHSVASTGAIIIRSTVDDEAGYATFTMISPWVEANNGTAVLCEAGHTQLSIIGGNFGATVGGKNISVGDIYNVVLNNVTVLDGTVTLAAATSTIIGGTIATLTDTSTYQNHINVITSGGNLNRQTSNAAINWTPTTLGYFGATPATKQVITGALSSVTDAAAKAVLTSIISALSTPGQMTDSTT